VHRGGGGARQNTVVKSAPPAVDFAITVLSIPKCHSDFAENTQLQPDNPVGTAGHHDARRHTTTLNNKALPEFKDNLKFVEGWIQSFIAVCVRTPSHQCVNLNSYLSRYLRRQSDVLEKNQ